MSPFSAYTVNYIADAERHVYTLFYGISSMNRNFQTVHLQASLGLRPRRPH